MCILQVNEEIQPRSALQLGLVYTDDENLFVSRAAPMASFFFSEDASY